MKSKNLFALAFSALALVVLIFALKPEKASATTWSFPSGTSFLCGMRSAGLDNKGTIKLTLPISCDYAGSPLSYYIPWTFSGTYTADSSSEDGDALCNWNGSVVGIDYGSNFQTDT